MIIMNSAEVVAALAAALPPEALIIEEADALFAARQLAYPALERLGTVLTEDVCVPIAAVRDMIARIEQIASEHDILIASIAHIGDGNLHPLLIADPGDTAAREHAKIAFEEILSTALDLGGRVTGEHGGPWREGDRFECE